MARKDLPVKLRRCFRSSFEIRFISITLILAGCILAIFVADRLNNSRMGRAWIAMREDEDVARAMGIHVTKYKLLAFAIGAIFCRRCRGDFCGQAGHDFSC